MKMVEYLAENVYPTFDLRFTTTLPIMHNYLWKSKKWVLKFQGIRKDSEAGKNATMAKSVRECYLETYQYLNAQVKDYKVLRTGCPSDKIKGDKPTPAPNLVKKEPAMQEIEEKVKKVVKFSII